MTTVIPLPQDRDSRDVERFAQSPVLAEPGGGERPRRRCAGRAHQLATASVATPAHIGGAGGAAGVAAAGRTPAAVAIAALLAACLAVRAAGAADFQVNTYTTGFQMAAEVALDRAGGFVVVWQSDGSAGTDDSGRSIQMRRYDASGTPLGGELQVNGYTTATQDLPRVAVAPDGRFVVTWVSSGSPGDDTDSYSIQARRFGTDGGPLGDQFQVNTITTGAQDAPAIGIGADASFVIAWESQSSRGDDSSGRSVQARRYDASGTALADELQVNAYTTSGQDSADVATLADGRFVVAWTSNGSDGSDTDHSSVHLRELSSAGSPVTGDMQLNSYTTGAQIRPRVAVGGDGAAVVSWISLGDGRLRARRYGGGLPLGPDFEVGTVSTSSIVKSDVAVGQFGEFAAAWGPSSPGLDVAARRYAANGAPVADAGIANTHTTGVQGYPSIAMDPDGDLVLVWISDDSPGDDTDVGIVAGLVPGSLRAHWSFDEGAGAILGDTAGPTADDGTINGASWIPGTHGQALSFDGAGDSVALPLAGDLVLAGDMVTVAARVRLDALPTGLGEPFASFFDSSEDAFILYLARDAAELRFKVTDATGAAERPGIPQADLQTGSWLHVAGVYDGAVANQARIYLNGVLADSHPMAGNDLRLTTQAFAIGRDGVAAQYFLPGAIDDLKIWDRALNDAEVAFLAMDLFADGFESGSTAAWSTVVP